MTTKSQLLTYNTCHNIDMDACRNLSREELRILARKCKVLMGRKKHEQICQEIYDKSLDNGHGGSLTVEDSPHTRSRSRSPPHTRSRSHSPHTRLNSPHARASVRSLPTETTIHTQDSVDTIVKKQAANILNELYTDHKTSFTNVAKYYSNNPNKYTFASCDIHVDRIGLLPNADKSASSAQIYATYSKLVNANLVIKMWADYQKTWETYCLRAEWAIYTFIMPFLYYEKITPCVLIPFQSGLCTAEQFTTEILPRMGGATLKSLPPRIRHIVTPHIDMSFNKFSQHSALFTPEQVYPLIFQLVYTITAFASAGLRHNDCHMQNIRILCDPNHTQFKMGFRLDGGKIIYNTSPVMAILFDFDRMGVDNRWAEKLRNLCTSTDGPGTHCTDWNMCDEPIYGCRDLLILVIQAFSIVPLPLKNYFADKILVGNPKARERIHKYMRFTNNRMAVDWPNSKYKEYVFADLSDKDAVDIYPKSVDVLNDPEFLRLCLSSSYLSETVHNKNQYPIYSYSKNSVDVGKFNLFVKRFYGS